MKNISYFFLCTTVILSACGVRGRPLPPETPPLLGRGEPSFSKATEKIQVPTKKKKKNENSDSEEPSEGDQ